MGIAPRYPMKPVALLFLLGALAPFATAAESTPTPDTVCRILRRSPAVTFPQRLLQAGVTNGSVTTVLEVGTDGRISDLLISAYSRPEFAQEVSRSVKDWTFAPSTSAGQPIVSIVTIEFEFRVNGVLAYEKRYPAEDEPVDPDHKYSYFAHGSANLDRKPTLLRTESPVYPKAWIEQGRKGAILVRFFIDETGRPRIPSIPAGTDPYLSSAAIAALKTWRFEPPLDRGQPVLAFAEQVFVFDPPKLAANP